MNVFKECQTKKAYLDPFSIKKHKNLNFLIQNSEEKVMKLIFLLFYSVFLFSCAQKVSTLKSSSNKSEDIIYQSSLSSKKKFMSCNFFSDETFRGYISHSSEQDNCLHIDITESPKELFKNDDLFLQIYPFRVSEDEMEYGFSQTIYTLPKLDKKKVLIKSQIIDAHVVQVELDQEADYFFLDHTLELCSLDEKWQGLQLVIYNRRERQKEPIPIRITKFLKPPFLTHPEYFRDKAGNGLAVYHPFLEFIPELKSEPGSYYELAEQLCSRL